MRIVKGVLRSNLPRGTRHLRRRRGWRQEDLADAAGVSREAVSRLERGNLRGASLRTVEKVAAALDANVDVTLRWEGAELDRIIDAAHARLQESVAHDLGFVGWLVRVEVSFNNYGDRGRVDILAFHPAFRTLLVVEVKSALGDLQDTLGRLDVKVRLGRSLAREAGWMDVVAIVPMLAIGDTRTARRTVAYHATLFDRYRLRGRQARAWLRSPLAPIPSGLLTFVKLPDSHRVTTTRARRVRTVNSKP